ncbi:S46 family peptidase [candidate division KSB1 bacterium]|nr:S46 family peptidase [candidate division KSB1 bacterium]
MPRSMILWLFIFLQWASAEEGMYPMSELHRIDFAAVGFQLSEKDIFNPDSISLTDAIVNINGCTGSFVSPQGLMLTNHHCAFGAIQRVSSPDHDYLQDGFAALSMTDEIPAKGYTVRITESYRDVSDPILSAMAVENDFALRTKAKERKIKELIAEVEKDNPGKRAEVAEMFNGKSYMLFIYKFLRDVRLVYAPPFGIGNFGGEEDNWVWPRHTGDFAFMRAYVAPDGSSADYAADNVPYVPRKYLRVAPQGVDDQELIFLLGYPGRTFRHSTSHYLEYESTVRMPFIVDWYGFQIKLMEDQSRKDRDVALKLASPIKGLSNTYKNYRGKLKGIKRIDLVTKKQNEEKQLQAFIDADPQRKAVHGSTLQEISRLYRERTEAASYEMLMDQFLRSSRPLGIAYTLYQSSIESQKPDLERESAFMERNVSRTKQRLRLGLANFYQPADQLIFAAFLNKWQELPPSQHPAAIRKLLADKNPQKAIDKFLNGAYTKTRVLDSDWVMAYWGCQPDELVKLKDPFIDIARTLYPDMQALREIRRRRSGELDKLYAQLMDVKQLFEGSDFIPDANGTQRLTFGRIRGYSPADAVTYHPITTVGGIVEKNTGQDPFDAPAQLIDLHREKDFGRFMHEKLHDVPVAILYDADTTGGNSGSAVMNARGELVGLNFDRAFEATINDYAWSQDYSRSIGVDIRYILWVLQKYSGAVNLLQEMGVE